MTMGFATTLRTSRADAIKTAIDAGAGAGLIRIYDGARPATGGTATTLLAELTCTDPCSTGAVAGVLTLSAINSDASANATGTATWARIVDSSGTFVLDMSVSTAAADCNLNSTSIATGITVAITSCVITEGNP
jgi:hypothetical protein